MLAGIGVPAVAVGAVLVGVGVLLVAAAIAVGATLAGAAVAVVRVAVAAGPLAPPAPTTKTQPQRPPILLAIQPWGAI